MNNTQGMVGCAIGCWLVALLGGALAAVLLWLLGGWTFVQGAFAAVVVAGVAGLLLSAIMCRPLPALGEVQAGQSGDDEGAPTPSAAARSADATTTAPKAEDAPAPKAEPAPKADPAPEAEASTPAPKAESAKPEASKPAPKVADAPKPAAKPKAASAQDAGAKPETLDGPRAGGADDLKQIKGVGPKLEALLNSMGFYHFDQIAAWGADELAWVDQNLEGFKGRATRDDWVPQARTLAAGGNTEFSSKVKKGGVY